MVKIIGGIYLALMAINGPLVTGGSAGKIKVLFNHLEIIAKILLKIFMK